MHSSRSFLWTILGSALWLSVMAIPTLAETASFIPASPENTRMADGSPLPEKIESIGWKWHPEKGNSGVLESIPNQERKTAILMVKAAGLEADAIYEVFCYFWADDASIEGANPQPLRAVQLGLSLATMHPFDGVRPDALVLKEPWVITPGYKTGQAYGYQVVVEESDPLPGLAGIITSQGNFRLIRARLGCSRAGKDGSLPVFFSANSGSRTVGSAMIDGIALRPAAPNTPLDLVWKPGTRLHLSIRAGDPVTIRRELEAGADVNAFDEENLTPLFYAAACGDAALVRNLLDHGAKPNQPAQSVSPLTAAAIISDTAITQILLDKGATVPLTSPQDKGALAIDVDPRFLHPVIASIRAGSVPVLKQLLKANPGFNIQEFVDDSKKIEILRKPEWRALCLVGDSMVRQNWDMAALLIDHDLPIIGRDIQHYTKSDGLMLARAVLIGADALPVVEAMLRRGETPVVGTNTDYYHLDALTTAAWRGNVGLVQRFLPFADDMSSIYQNWLLEHALYSENPEIIEMIRKKFPEAKAPRWQAPPSSSESKDALDEGAKRWFLPRTSPPPQGGSRQKPGKHTLAVIAEPGATGAGDTLAAQASNAGGWKVVERELIESTIRENSFSKPWLDGEHRLAELGDRLTADCLVVVTAIRVKKEVVYRFEVVEVATGLEIHREHMKDEAFLDPKEVADFLTRAARALDAAGRNERHQAITLLTFSTQGQMANPLTVSDLLRAAVRHAVDATPGLISLSRSQSSRLVEEQALNGKNSIWGASHMIEGVASVNSDGKLKVTLRLETFKDGATTKTDAEASGEAASIAETTVAAWKKLMSSLKNPIIIPDQKPDAPDTALNEGRRLMREAEWLHALEAVPDSYLPLIESAIALGVPSEETILRHLGAYFLHYNTRSLAFSDEFAHMLPAVRRLLELTSWYLERSGSDYFKGGIDEQHLNGAYKSNEIWHAIVRLSEVRERILRTQLSDELKREFETFSTELDALTRRYFALLQTVPDPHPSRFSVRIGDDRFYQSNPVLAEAKVTLAAAGVSLTKLLNVSSDENPDTGEGSGIYFFESLESRKQLAKRMIERIGDAPSARMKLAKADLECFVSASADRPHAVRRLIEACVEAQRQASLDGQAINPNLLSRSILKACTTSFLFGFYPTSCSLEHDSSMLPALLFSSEFSPDFLIRYHTYQNTFPVIRSRRFGKNEETSSDIDAFREGICGYYPWEHRRLEDEEKKKTTEKKPEPAGIISTPQSKNLLWLIFGSGKSKPASDKSTKNKSTPKLLNATLLADLRTSKASGIMIWPFVDNTNPDLLWTFYFPVLDDGIGVNLPGEGGMQSLLKEYDAPWLLGIDCRSGHITRKINLHSAAGEAYGLDLSNRKCQIWSMTLDQTPSRILTKVDWSLKAGEYGGNYPVIIDKETGKAHPIPDKPQITHGRKIPFFDLWGPQNGVVGIGENFFYLSRTGYWNDRARKYAGSDALAIYQIFPDLSVKPLTEMGRRPELTPFDAVDRAPMTITPHDDRLMVIHQSTIADYDPVSGDWSLVASAPDQTPSRKDVLPVIDSQYWNFLRSINELKVNGNATEWIALGWLERGQHAPGVLPFASRSKGMRNLQITAPIPDDFLASSYAVEKIKSKKDGKEQERRTLFKDHPDFKNPDLVVLGQTEDDLIVGMQTGEYYDWKRPSRNASHLPFLWKISKKEILNNLNDE